MPSGSHVWLVLLWSSYNKNTTLGKVCRSNSSYFVSVFKEYIKQLVLFPHGFSCCDLRLGRAVKGSEHLADLKRHSFVSLKALCATTPVVLQTTFESRLHTLSFPFFSPSLLLFCPFPLRHSVPRPLCVVRCGFTLTWQGETRTACWDMSSSARGNCGITPKATATQYSILARFGFSQQKKEKKRMLSPLRTALAVRERACEALDRYILRKPQPRFKTVFFLARLDRLLLTLTSFSMRHSLENPAIFHISCCCFYELLGLAC